MAAISETLRNDLLDAEFAEVYAESFLDTYVATQIKVIREQQEMTQKALAEKLGTTQTVISRIENVNYSSWNIGTLKSLARAFGLRLRVSFETVGSLIDDVERFSRGSLQRVPRDKDPILHQVGSTKYPTGVESDGAISGDVALDGTSTGDGQKYPRVNVAARGVSKAQSDFNSAWNLRLLKGSSVGISAGNVRVMESTPQIPQAKSA